MSAATPLEDFALPQAQRLVNVDVRRPWPNNVPPVQDALEAMSGDAMVHVDLQPVHDRVVSLLPHHLLDAVRTSVVGHEDPLGQATALAWRALLADALLDAAFGVDAEALPALIDATVDAREKIVAASLFSLDGEEGSASLVAALGAAIERFTERARFKAAPRKAAAPRPAEAERGLGRHARLLRLVFGLVMLLVVFQQLGAYFDAEVATRDWIVVGDVERGHAFLAPARGGVTEATLPTAVEELRREGLDARRMPNGEWVVFKPGAEP